MHEKMLEGLALLILHEAGKSRRGPIPFRLYENLVKQIWWISIELPCDTIEALSSTLSINLVIVS